MSTIQMDIQRMCERALVTLNQLNWSNVLHVIVCNGNGIVTMETVIG